MLHKFLSALCISRFTMSHFPVICLDKSENVSHFQKAHRPQKDYHPEEKVYSDKTHSKRTQQCKHHRSKEVLLKGKCTCFGNNCQMSSTVLLLATSATEYGASLCLIWLCFCVSLVQPAVEQGGAGHGPGPESWDTAGT